MPGLNPDIDPDGLLEYSVVFTDRSLNHMSRRFQDDMNGISAALRDAYHADRVALVPGGGTYAMEAVARQLAAGRRCLVLRNGYFSYRWSQILDAGGFAGEVTVLKAELRDAGAESPFAPPSIDKVVATIEAERPEVVFAPHVETSAGLLLPDDYLAALAAATRAAGGLLVLDCIASGALWVDMARLDVDVLISAPQKGWSGSPCAGAVMLNQRAADAVAASSSSSFACDLGRWLEIMAAYENGGHAYHATLPTDGLRTFHAALRETQAFGLERARAAQVELGGAVRDLLEARGFASVAAPGFGAPGVVVSYTDDPEISSGRAFASVGLQVAAGVPLMCDEPDTFQTFRIGLFGLDKLAAVDRTVAHLREALAAVQQR